MRDISKYLRLFCGTTILLYDFEARECDAALTEDPFLKNRVVLKFRVVANHKASASQDI